MKLIKIEKERDFWYVDFDEKLKSAHVNTILVYKNCTLKSTFLS